MSSIAERLKKIRNEYGLNQKKFAERIGVTNAHISRMEKGITVPSEALSKLICREFDINMEWLKHETEPMYISDFNIDEKMGDATAIFNKLLHSENGTIRNLAAELDLLFSKITYTEQLTDDMAILYLNNIINLMSIVNKYTAVIKDDMTNKQLTIEEVQIMNFSMLKNDLLNYVDELQRIVFLSQKSDL